MLLTYARIWSTLTTGEIRSKPAAADWVMNLLPEECQPVMMREKSICIGEESEYFDDIKSFIKPCAAFMVDKINEQISTVNFNDSSTTIKMAEDLS